MLCSSLKYLLEINLLIEIFPECSTFPDLVQQFLKASNQSNPYPMANVPYSTAGGSSSLTYTMENVPTRGNTESYMDFFNSSR